MSGDSYPTELGWAEMADIAEDVLHEIVLMHVDEWVVRSVAEGEYGRDVSDTQAQAIRMAVINAELTPDYAEILKAEQGGL